MTDPPSPPGPPPMPDEVAELWHLFVTVKARLGELEEITERMVATCADPVAVADFWLWKAAR